MVRVGDYETMYFGKKATFSDGERGDSTVLMARGPAIWGMGGCMNLMG